MKFKVGDRVKVIDLEENRVGDLGVEVGDQGIVKGIGNYCVWVRIFREDAYNKVDTIIESVDGYMDPTSLVGSDYSETLKAFCFDEYDLELIEEAGEVGASGKADDKVCLDKVKLLIWLQEKGFLTRNDLSTCKVNSFIEGVTSEKKFTIREIVLMLFALANCYSGYQHDGIEEGLKECIKE